MRRPFLAGNWKMNLASGAARELAAALVANVGSLNDRDIAIFPTALSLEACAEVARGSQVRIGAQNFWPEDDGAFTGELSTHLLRDAGADLLLCGHSERRHVLGEDDAVVNRKVRRGLADDFDIILCCGELLDEREANTTDAVNARQIRAGLDGVSASDMARVTIAYEPVWAIGTGKTATPEIAQEVHHKIRALLGELYSADVAAATRIQYGGSVKPTNVDDLLAMPDVDGALVGGASLDADSFERIVRANIAS